MGRSSAGTGAVLPTTLLTATRLGRLVPLGRKRRHLEHRGGGGRGVGCLRPSVRDAVSGDDLARVRAGVRVGLRAAVRVTLALTSLLAN